MQYVALQAVLAKRNNKSQPTYNPKKMNLTKKTGTENWPMRISYGAPGTATPPSTGRLSVNG